MVRGHGGRAKQKIGSRDCQRPGSKGHAARSSQQAARSKLAGSRDGGEWWIVEGWRVARGRLISWWRTAARKEQGRLVRGLPAALSCVHGKVACFQPWLAAASPSLPSLPLLPSSPFAHARCAGCPLIPRKRCRGPLGQVRWSMSADPGPGGIRYPVLRALQALLQPGEAKVQRQYYVAAPCYMYQDSILIPGLIAAVSVAMGLRY